MTKNIATTVEMVLHQQHKIKGDDDQSSSALTEKSRGCSSTFSKKQGIVDRDGQSTHWHHRQGLLEAGNEQQS